MRYRVMIKPEHFQAVTEKTGESPFDTERRGFMGSLFFCCRSRGNSPRDGYLNINDDDLDNLAALPPVSSSPQLGRRGHNE